MILTFVCKDAKSLFNDEPTPRFQSIERTVRRKLEILNAAKSLYDLKIPPGNRLEALQGNRFGQYSIRINDQWRLCFKWHEGNAFDVEIVDYH